MALKDPRKGEVLESCFATQPFVYHLTTLGNPEDIVWSSIRQMEARDTADSVLADRHGIKRKVDRRRIASGIRLYLNRAYELCCAGRTAEAASAPLMHYYSALNLAKALAEIRYPQLHRRRENYRHGISWRPNRNYLVDLENDFVTVQPRNVRSSGVWHLLWDFVRNGRFVAKNPIRFKVADLFALCPEISTEFDRTVANARFFTLVEPAIKADPEGRHAWIVFSVRRDELRDLKLTRTDCIEMVSHYGVAYEQVRTNPDALWSFEMKRPRPFRKLEDVYDELGKEMRAFNLFTVIEKGEMTYVVPDQRRLPRPLPQLVVLYTLLFWLGSLVRYDPHSLESLRDSRFWVLIDGFMNQSRLWLVELFEMYLYRIETRLASAR